MNAFDLQMHSTSSDGALAPAELVAEAKKRSLTVIALTDHDTVDGLNEAVVAGGELGVEVIAGVELSCEHGQLGLHILGYGLDYPNIELQAVLHRIQESRIARAKEMIRRLREQGFKVDYEKMRKRAAGVIGRPHLALEILENPANRELLGGIQNKHDFIVKFLTPGKPAYVETQELTTQEGTDLIHRAGGVAVWSHPAVHFPETFEGLETVLLELISSGLDGLEAFNPSQSEAASKFLLALAGKYNLLVTAGSDFERPPDPVSGLTGPQAVGDFNLYGFPADQIVLSLKSAIVKKRTR